MFKRSILKLNSSILIITLVISLNIFTTSANTETTTSTTTKNDSVSITGNTTPVSPTTNTTPVAFTTNTSPVIFTTNTAPAVFTTNASTVALTTSASPVVFTTSTAPTAPVAFAANTTPISSTTSASPVSFTNNTETLSPTISTTPISTVIKARAEDDRAISIQDFGAHSIDEEGYANFDSSQAINKAIQFAKENDSTSVDFGSGRFYARDICLESDITYYSSKGAELIASADIQVWHSVLYANNKSNITIDGLTVNGNKQVVFGNVDKGSMLIEFSTSNNITINNCYLYNNWYAGIKLRNNCNYITVKNNTIFDTDCGIISEQAASNNLLIDGNTIYGSKENQNSEPISIFNTNSNGLAHDITITNNILHDKLYGFGILVVNATKVLIKGNTIYNTCAGINIGVASGMTSSNVTASSDITITENNIYNCSGGINGELNDSTISKNTIHDLKGTGIWLMTPKGKPIITNNKITNNNITNINSIGGTENAVRLDNTSSCLIEYNTVSDTRSKVLHLIVLQVAGTNSSNNTVQNNTSLGATTKYGYQIYIRDAKNTIVQNNTASILNQGTGSKFAHAKLINN